MKKEPIFDSIDTVGKFLVDSINARYKITKRVDQLRKEVVSLLYSFKRNFIRSMVEACLIVSGVLAFILGIVLFANRYLPLDIILLAYGLIILLIVLWQIKLR